MNFSDDILALCDRRHTTSILGRVASRPAACRPIRGHAPLLPGHLHNCGRRATRELLGIRERLRPEPSAPQLRIALRGYQLPVFMDRTTGILVLHWSRQIGKSFTLAAWAVDRLLTRPGRLVTVLSNSRENGAEFVAKCAEVCRLNGTAFESVDKSQGVRFQNMRYEIRIRSHGRVGRIKVLAANPRTARGFSGDLILDEFAFHEDSAAIWEAAEPILAANPDYLCRIASTGNGKHNLFYRMTMSPHDLNPNPNPPRSSDPLAPETPDAPDVMGSTCVSRVPSGVSPDEFSAGPAPSPSPEIDRTIPPTAPDPTSSLVGTWPCANTCRASQTSPSSAPSPVGTRCRASQTPPPSPAPEPSGPHLNVEPPSAKTSMLNVECFGPSAPSPSPEIDRTIPATTAPTPSSSSSPVGTWPCANTCRASQTSPLSPAPEPSGPQFEVQRSMFDVRCSLPEETAPAAFLTSPTGFSVSRIPRSEAFRQGVLIYDPNTRQPITPDQARAKSLDKRAYDQNYECSFNDENGTLLTHELISAAERDDVGFICDQDWSNPVYSPSNLEVGTRCCASQTSCLEFLRDCQGPLFIGFDVARKGDLSVITVIENLHGLKLVRAILRMTDLRLPDQQSRLREICKLPTFRRAAIDMTGLGLGLFEYAQKEFGSSRIHGINFAATVPATKAIRMEGRPQEKVRVTEALALELLQTYEDRRIQHPADQQLRDDLRKPEKLTTPGGRVSIAAARDAAGHADHFWSFALALEAAGRAPNLPPGHCGIELIPRRPPEWR